jgi:hypothetical protein
VRVGAANLAVSARQAASLFKQIVSSPRATSFSGVTQRLPK